MTDAVTFGRNFVATVNALINAIESAQLQQDRLASEPELALAAADALKASGRPDMTEQIVNDAASAIVQIAFAYGSGTPTQKSLLYKML
jgi:hypothetical protein